MYAFGHISLAIYVLYKITKDLRKSLILTPLTLLPDLDLFLNLKHREIFHSIFVIPVFLISVFIINKLFRLNLNNKETIIISFLLYFLHIIADIVCGNVMLFPGIIIGTQCKLDPIKDAIFGFIFYFLLLYEIKKYS